LPSRPGITPVGAGVSAELDDEADAEVEALWDGVEELAGLGVDEGSAGKDGAGGSLGGMAGADVEDAGTGELEGAPTTGGVVVGEGLIQIVDFLGQFARRTMAWWCIAVGRAWARAKKKERAKRRNRLANISESV